MASVFPNVTRSDSGSFLERLAQGRIAPSKDERVYSILSAIEGALQQRNTLERLNEILEDSKRTLLELLRSQCEPVVAKALTLKAINICLAKQHFRARSTTLLSRPFGLIVDPSNSCNLACPGCVHSQTVKERHIFQWGTGTLPLPRLSRYLKAYGPYAIHANFCNYGEPLVNPETPRFVREAKGYLVGTMLSTNLSLPRLNAEACVASGLDYMLISVDGATQAVYQKFRRKGQLDVVLHNIERLVKAKRDQGRTTPILVWRLITFEHNIHEIPLCIEMARQLGVDQFTTTPAQDVSWDDPSIRVAEIDPVSVMFNRRAQLDILDNWNAFPDGLNTAVIERAFDAPWIEDTSAVPPEWTRDAGSATTCNWLYKSMSMDASGRIIPCCASPRPDADLVFADFDTTPTENMFNSEKYRLSRLSFVDKETYRQNLDQSQLAQEPFCSRCDWDKEATNTRGDNISTYFQAASRELFNRDSLAVLSDW